MTRYHTGDPSGAQIIADILRRLHILESGHRASDTAVDKGLFTVRSGATMEVRRPTDDAVVARIGRLRSDDLWGIAAYNPQANTDAPMIEVGAGEPGGFLDDGILNITDVDGSIIFNIAQPWGLGAPYAAYNITASALLTTPTTTTTSGSFAPLWTAFGQTYHPSIMVHYVIQTDVGTTAEVRLRDGYNSYPTTPAISYGSGTNAIDAQSYQHAGTQLAEAPFAGMGFRTELEARRVSGGGVVRLQAIAALGVAA
ncbi:hypothetical protein ABZS66_36295 [Dactylosporangium sp. NPDC005572]|uniref:hypothetical protein n=1 Tax=Dactylosporangium sp. NPDC005572 TaxID=3156889 RepID=UPI0033BE5500